MSDENPLEPILPDEVIAKLRAIVGELLSQPPQVSIGGKAAIAAAGRVIRLQGIATAEAFGSGTLQIIDAAESKKRWASPEGATAIAAIVSKTVAACAEELVSKWLFEYMHLSEETAREAARWFASKEHRVHGKPLMFDDLKQKGLNVIRLEKDDDALQDLVLSVFHATMVTFEVTPALNSRKITTEKAFSSSCKRPFR